MCAHPIDEFREPVAIVLRHRTRQILSLSAFTMRRDHQALRDLIRNAGAIVPPHQMQQHVQSSSGAGRGQHLSRIDIERVGFHGHARITFAQSLGVAPMRRDTPAIEDAGRSKHEHA
jgi:hypothetical protein